jgi:heterodisulfide reductase subunit C
VIDIFFRIGEGGVLVNKEFLKEVEARSGQHLAECYLCGKCTAGCPMASEMDLPPHLLIRYLQLGREDEALRSQAIWLCGSAQICTARCPKDIDVAAVYDTLRQMAYERGMVRPEVADIRAFHIAFLKGMRKYGRMNEVDLTRRYKIKTGHLLQDTSLAPAMFLKGKLRLKPTRIKGVDEIRGIFERADLKL